MRIKTIENNHLYWDGCDTVALAKKYGTPVYVLSENAILERTDELHRDFLDKYDNVRVAFASKAFNTLAMCQLVNQVGLSLDVVSGGELYTAMAANFPAEHIEFNGNNKSQAELEMAVEYGVGRIIVDGLTEVERLAVICRRMKKTAKILFRITPEITVDTHDFISTGQKDSKFGIPLNPEILFPQIEAAIAMPEIEFYGLHFHIGSQLADNSTHLAAAKVALSLVSEIKARYDFTVKELNYGGGFGVEYVPGDLRQPYRYFLDPLMALTEDYCAKHDLKRPAIVIEPGRSLVAEAGITLHTIGEIKTLPGLRTYASVDGGMTDNIRPGLYQADYTGIVANKAEEEKSQKVTISGKACESTDILVKDLAVAPLAPGDIFATFTTGAYGYSMASNYNKLPIPPVVLVKDGKDQLIVAQQSYAQMIQNERRLKEWA
ncbi:diaminopimelate decarboxylase [Enterococcus asini]|uniref:diaminopimelate decarboxylase n=1 Tax=Enterococcus asini TaxID=57732 RepID=UPI00288E906B|nr:diaminopimelate decarboxylase [Enterococcus asini]MDT2757634.1 diaminopimelate decarboxylase [Enterococcus asini]